MKQAGVQRSVRVGVAIGMCGHIWPTMMAHGCGFVLGRPTGVRVCIDMHTGSGNAGAGAEGAVGPGGQLSAQQARAACNPTPTLYWLDNIQSFQITAGAQGQGLVHLPGHAGSGQGHGRGQRVGVHFLEVCGQGGATICQLNLRCCAQRLHLCGQRRMFGGGGGCMCSGGRSAGEQVVCGTYDACSLLWPEAGEHPTSAPHSNLYQSCRRLTSVCTKSVMAAVVG